MTTPTSHGKFAGEWSAEDALAWFQESDFLNSPPYFLSHWKTNKRFFYALGGLVAFEETARELVVAGEILVSEGGASADEVFAVFCEMALRKKKGVCGYYVGASWHPRDFFKAALGASTVLPLDRFELSEPRFKEVRRSLRKGDQRGLTVVAVDRDDGWSVKKVTSLYDRWVQTKPGIEVRFLLSRPDSKCLTQNYEEWFAVEKDGVYLAFCSLLPYMKDGKLCFYLDNILHDPKKESHALGYLISFLIETLHEQGVFEFNLGLSPFVRFQGASSKAWIEKVLGLFYQFPLLYKAKGLHRFKKKFGGWESPEYCFFNQKENQLKQLVEMAGVTFHMRS